jgi:D-alanyl-D-alanine carboxypeptidase/D-alanyl-D-alanine-endopeptidase (penicillin-binding protein 4)
LPSTVTRRPASSSVIGPTSIRGSARRGWLGAAGQRPEARRELFEGERLDEVVVGAGIEPGHPVAHGVARGQHQDRRLAPPLPEALGDLDAGDVGQADIQDDRLDPVGLRQLEAGLPIGGEIDDVAVLLEEALEDPPEPLVVLDDQQVHRARGSLSTARS